MNHLKRPFLFVANGLVVLSSALFFILVIVSEMMESLAKEKVSPAELANPDPITRSDAMFLVDFLQTAKAYCWFFGVLLFVIGLVNFWLIPWRTLRPVVGTKCEPDGPANRSQPIRAETNSTSVAAGSDR